MSKLQKQMVAWVKPKAYVHVCVYVCMHVCMYVCAYICVCVCMYVCMYVHIYVCMYVHMYVCMFVCMYNGNKCPWLTDGNRPQTDHTFKHNMLPKSHASPSTWCDKVNLYLRRFHRVRCTLEMWCSVAPVWWISAAGIDPTTPWLQWHGRSPWPSQSADTLQQKLVTAK